MDAERTRKMMFLRLNSDRVNEVKYVNTGLAGIQLVHEEARSQVTAAQAEGAGEVVVLDRPG